MRIVTGNEMKEIDGWAINDLGIPSLLLMENAGLSVVTKIKKILKNLKGKNVTILVGKGNNGGDALVVARHLYQLGAEVKMFLLFDPDSFKDDVIRNWQMIEALGIKWHLMNDDNSFYLLKLSLNKSDLVVDGIFGTGFRGDPEEKIGRVIKIVNEYSCPILAIDIPSGVDANTGQIGEPCIKADYVVTFAWAKRGLLLYPGKTKVGELEVADISIPELGIDILTTEQHYIDNSLAKECLPELNWEGHKNTYGHVLVVAGSEGMTGAAALSSRAALRVGTGLVTTCLPESLADLFDVIYPEIITKPVAETRDRTLAYAAWQDIEKGLQNKKAVVYGPGLTTQPEIKDILAKLLEKVKIPLVVDADGLNVLAQDTSILNKAQGPIILTPHPGEMARLTSLSTEDVQANRIEVSEMVAKELNAIVVLKGAGTIITTPDGKLFINSTGSPALATAGTGDVLAGVIGGLLAQGIEPVKAAVLGVYIHGLAGDLAGIEKGMRGVIAGDVLEKLPYAIKAIES